MKCLFERFCFCALRKCLRRFKNETVLFKHMCTVVYPLFLLLVQGVVKRWKDKKRIMEGVEVVRAFTCTSTETPYFFFFFFLAFVVLSLSLFLFCRLRFYIFFPPLRVGLVVVRVSLF